MVVMENSKPTEDNLGCYFQTLGCLNAVIIAQLVGTFLRQLRPRKKVYSYVSHCLCTADFSDEKALAGCKSRRHSSQPRSLCRGLCYLICAVTPHVPERKWSEVFSK